MEQRGDPQLEERLQGLLVKDGSSELTLAELQPHVRNLFAVLEAEAKEQLRQEMAGEDPADCGFLHAVTHETTSPRSSVRLVF